MKFTDSSALSTRVHTSVSQEQQHSVHVCAHKQECLKDSSTLSTRVHTHRGVSSKAKDKPPIKNWRQLQLSPIYSDALIKYLLSVWPEKGFTGLYDRKTTFLLSLLSSVGPVPRG